MLFHSEDIMKTKTLAPKKIDLDLTCQELQALQRKRSVVIKSRVMQENRLVAVIAGTLDYHSGLDSNEREKLFKKARQVVADVREGADHPYAAIVKASSSGIEELEVLQAVIDKEMVGLVKNLPIYNWIEKPEQRGFGAQSLATVVGECGNLCNYPNPAKVWRRMGLAPWTHNGKTLMGATWRSGTQGKLPAPEWEEFGYAVRRRSVAWNIGECLIKQNAPGPYRQRYDEAKAAAKLSHPDWTDGHRNNHAKLLATKRLFRELWAEWHRLHK